MSGVVVEELEINTREHNRACTTAPRIFRTSTTRHAFDVDVDGCSAVEVETEEAPLGSSSERLSIGEGLLVRPVERFGSKHRMFDWNTNRHGCVSRRRSRLTSWRST